MTGALPTDPAERKRIPLCSGVLDYFPSALAEVAKRSFQGNEQHNPGEPLHWARGKSTDHLDAAVRHIMERDLAGAAWRILAALQLECEANGAPVAPGARQPPQDGKNPLKDYFDKVERTAANLKVTFPTRCSSEFLRDEQATGV